MKTMITNGKIITPFRMIEGGGVLVEGNKITDIIEKNVDHELPDTQYINAKGNYISPGFIDMHVHGGGNADVMDGTVESVLTMCTIHARFGTTAIVPTTLAAPWKDIYRAIDGVKDAQPEKEGARILGVHLEGPYCSPAEAGAQNPSSIQNPNPADYLKVLDYWNGILIMTAAPELDGGLRLGRELQKRGILASMGHSSANYSEVLKAIENGYTHITHFYSGCSMMHRENAYRIAGLVESGYLMDELTVEIIADGKHLPPSLLKLIYKVKGAGRTALVTDGTAYSGVPMEDLQESIFSNGLEVIYDDEVMKLKDRSCFAGSVATTNRLVRNMVKLAEVPLIQAVKMASYTPAGILKIGHKKGSLSIGKDADILIFNDNIDIQMTMVEGDIVFQD